MPGFISSVTKLILLGYGVQAQGGQDSSKLDNNLIHRVLKVRAPQREDLDATTVGKQGHLARLTPHPLPCPLPRPLHRLRTLSHVSRSAGKGAMRGKMIYSDDVDAPTFSQDSFLDKSARNGQPQNSFPAKDVAFTKVVGACEGHPNSLDAFRVGCMPSRRAVLCRAPALVAGVLAVEKDPVLAAEDESPAAYCRSLQGAKSELVALRDQLASSASLGAKPPFAELTRQLKAGELGKLRATCAGMDVLLSNEGREYLEREKLFAENNFVSKMACLSFECAYDGRAPPSESLLGCLRNFEDGLALGMKGNARITAVGLGGNADDMLEKLDSYLSQVQGSFKTICRMA